MRPGTGYRAPRFADAAPFPAHWATPYIGLPWDATGEGPPPGANDGTPDRQTWRFHCWAFVRFVQARHFGRDLPTIPNPEDLLAQARAFRLHPERRRWTPVAQPADGDCVLMGRARVPVHVGVWIAAASGGVWIAAGGVLHCVQGAGVVFQSLAALALNGWKIHGYHRFRS